MKIVVVIGIMVFGVLGWAPSGVAAEYSVQRIGGNHGACFNNNKRVSGARYCHNCKGSGGNRVKWKFPVFCDGKPTNKIIKTELLCKKSISEEGEQLSQLYESAKEQLEDKISFFSWPWASCDIRAWDE